MKKIIYLCVLLIIGVACDQVDSVKINSRSLDSVKVSTPNSGEGDPLRTAFEKVNLAIDQVNTNTEDIVLKLNISDTAAMLDPYALTSEISASTGISESDAADMISDSLSALSDNAELGEESLGNPTVDDYVLSSKIDGTRAWVAQSGGSTYDTTYLYSVITALTSRIAVLEDSCGIVAESTLKSGLISYYNFEESSGDLIDQTDSGNDGTLVNSPTVEQTDVNNYCYTFASASSQYITISTDDFDLQKFTINAWTKTSTSGYMGAFSNASSTTGYWLATEGSYMRGRAFLDETTDYVTGNDDITDGSWHMETLTWDGDSLKLYVDGVLDGTPLDLTGTISYTNATPQISARNSTAYWNGSIDEVGFWNRLVTVDSLWNDGDGRFPY